MTAAEIRAEITATEAAIAATRSVDSMTNGDRSVRFRSLDDQMAYLSRLQGMLAVAEGQTRTRYASTSKGL